MGKSEDSSSLFPCAFGYDPNKFVVVGILDRYFHVYFILNGVV
jgi:hypothetical protein